MLGIFIHILSESSIHMHRNPQPRDLAIVGLMLLQGLRSQEVLDLNRDDLLQSEAQIRVRGKGNKTRFLPLAPEANQLLDHYLRLERPRTSTNALFVSLKGHARGARMSPAGLRSLFRYHRQTTGVKMANPHRFRHYADIRAMPMPDDTVFVNELPERVLDSADRFLTRHSSDH